MWSRVRWVVISKGPLVKPDVQVCHIHAGEIMALCCDGLWSLVAAGQIAEVVQNASLDHACAALIELARQAGGEDNISLILLKVHS